jgi:glucokinase
MVKNYYF